MHDIEPNPGPPRWPCSICSRSAKYASISCQHCPVWTHVNCAGLKKTDLTNPYTCPGCLPATQGPIRALSPPPPTPTPMPPPPPKHIPTSTPRRPVAPARPCRPTRCLDKIVILQWNVQHLRSRKADLLDVISCWSPDVLCLQEIKTDTVADCYTPPGFRAAIAPRNKRGGGVAVMVRDTLDFRTESRHVGPVEFVTVSIIGGPVVTSLYIPPRSSSGDIDLSEELHELLVRPVNHIVCADANAHSALWYSSLEDARGEEVEELLDDYGLATLNENHHTRAGNGSLTSPDVTIGTLDIALRATWTAGPPRGSDHCPIRIIIDKAKISPPPKPSRTLTNFRKADWRKFSLLVDNCLSKAWNGGPLEADSGSRLLSEAILYASARAIPQGRFRPSRSAEDPPASVIRLMKARDRIQHSNPLDPEILSLNRQIVEQHKEHRRQIWIDRVEDMNAKANTNQALLWNLIRCRSAAPRTQLALDFDDGHPPCTGDLAARKLGHKLIDSAGPRTARSKIWAEAKRMIWQDCKGAPRTVVEPAEVATAVSNSKNSFAIGPDRIAQAHLKHLPSIALRLMAAIFTDSLSQNRTPAVWKKAIVIFIPKPGKDPSKAASMRPISLLSPVAKILERIVLDRIRVDIAPPEHQHGFRSGCSTSTALTSITDWVTGRLNERKPARRTIAGAIDLKAAFDTVDHQLLFADIANSSISPVLKRWLVTYLNKRSIQARLGDCKSKWMTLRGGVPQGAVLSPSLFNFFTRGMPTPGPDCTLITYADDITVAASHTNLHTASSMLQTEVDKIADYLTERRLGVSAQKSQTIIFTSDPKEFNFNPAIKLMGVQIPVVTRCKLLGITLDTMMSMSPHVKEVKARISQRSNIVKALSGTSWGADKEVMIRTYKGLIKPLLTYAAPAWRHLASDTQLESLNARQRAILRTCTGLLKDSPKHHVHSESRCLPASAELELAATQFALGAYFNPKHPLHLIQAARPTPRPGRLPKAQATLSATPPAPGISKKLALRSSHTSFVGLHLQAQPPNRVLGAPPPPVRNEEKRLPKHVRSELARLRCGHSKLIPEYWARISD